eukprot:1189546-Prorocentrum_minimum.AAC.6
MRLEIRTTVVVCTAPQCSIEHRSIYGGLPYGGPDPPPQEGSKCWRGGPGPPRGWIEVLGGWGPRTFGRGASADG